MKRKWPKFYYYLKLHFQLLINLVFMLSSFYNYFNENVNNFFAILFVQMQ